MWKAIVIFLKQRYEHSLLISTYTERLYGQETTNFPCRTEIPDVSNSIYSRFAHSVLTGFFIYRPMHVTEKRRLLGGVSQLLKTALSKLRQTDNPFWRATFMQNFREVMLNSSDCVPTPQWPIRHISWFYGCSYKNTFYTSTSWHEHYTQFRIADSLHPFFLGGRAHHRTTYIRGRKPFPFEPKTMKNKRF